MATNTRFILLTQAVVIGISGDDYEVAFTGYDEIKIVSASHLAPSTIIQQVQELGQQKVAGDIIDLKTHKRRRVKKEKKVSKREQELVDTQSSWKSFNIGVSKKMKTQNIVKSLVESKPTVTTLGSFGEKKRHEFAKPRENPLDD